MNVATENGGIEERRFLPAAFMEPMMPPPVVMSILRVVGFSVLLLMAVGAGYYFGEQAGTLPRPAPARGVVADLVVRDFAWHFMRTFVHVWLYVGAAIVWGWPCLNRAFSTETPRAGVFRLMLPREVTVTLIALDAIALLFHVVTVNGRVDWPTVLALGGLAATLWMRSALRRQVAP